MFHLYQSNKIEALLAQLVKLLLQQDCHPLKSQTVVVENPGLAHWLKMQMANALGIAANIEFPMPSRFLWQVQRCVQTDLDEESVFSKETLTWLVLECLETPSIMNQPSFDLLQSYLKGDTEGAASQNDLQLAVKRYQLASNIADLYDQYLVFRPDWIEAWQNNDFRMDETHLGDQIWQGLLWIELVKLAEQKQLSTHHRASMLQDFMLLLKEGENKQSLPRDVIFFGFSTLPKHQIETLNLLSQHMDVHLLTPNPSLHYWGDVMDETVQAKLRMRNKSVELVDAGNDLLASLGLMGKDFQRMLLDIESIQEQPLFYESGEKAEGGSLLHTIQNQILNLQQARDTKTRIANTDTSLQVVGCHSAMREIEVLHDHLLSLFSNTKIEPQEIVVMIPDVASYAPYIDAVFNSASTAIPYSISDRPVQAEHPLLAAFISVLDIPSGRFTFSDVMSLLEVPAVYRAYGIEEHQLPKLKSWLTEAGIRWGYDSLQREKQGLPKWEQNTWLDGFKRLLMGYAVNSDVMIKGIAPIQSVEGLEVALLGPVIQFVQHLHLVSELSEKQFDATGWSEQIHRMIQQLFDVSEIEQPVVEHIYQVLESWVSGVQAVQYQAPLSFSVVTEGLKQKLKQVNGSQHFMVGKVNFCTLLPMRSIPFKVVAVLGLNDQDYPRSVTPNSLDLMRFKRRIGDRSRRDEDRYLFLEAILSARESLWLSYKSRNQKEDQPMTPSVVLAELLDYLQEGFEFDDGKKPLDHLFTQHPLQPFNRQYFSSNSSLFSFNKDWLSVHENDNHLTDVGKSTSVTDTFDVNEKEVLLEDFILFYQNPSKYYLNKRLNINLSMWADAQENDEPFDLDGLSKFHMKQQVLANRVKAIGKEAPEKNPGNNNTISTGRLAYGEIGLRQWDALQTSVAPLIEQCEQHLINQISSPLEINYRFRSLFSASDEADRDPIPLLGWVSHVFNEQLVSVVPSHLKAKHVIKLLLEHAALCAMGYQHTAKLICQNAVVTIKPKKKAESVEYLKPLMEAFLSARKTPLALLPEVAWELNRPAKQGGREYNNAKQAADAFYGIAGDFGRTGEVDDLHVIRCLGDLIDIPQDTYALGETLFSFWLECIEIVDHD